MKAVRDSVRYMKVTNLEGPPIITLDWRFNSRDKAKLREDIINKFSEEHVAPTLAEEMIRIVDTMFQLKSDLLLQKADSIQVNKGGLELLRLNNLDSRNSGVGLMLDMHAIRKAMI